jgi:hypothetical protein
MADPGVRPGEIAPAQADAMIASRPFIGLLTRARAPAAAAS